MELLLLVAGFHDHAHLLLLLHAWESNRRYITPPAATINLLGQKSARTIGASIAPTAPTRPRTLSKQLYYGSTRCPSNFIVVAEDVILLLLPVHLHDRGHKQESITCFVHAFIS